MDQWNGFGAALVITGEGKNVNISVSKQCCLFVFALLFAAEASERSCGFWPRSEPVAGGRLSAPGPAGVATKLCG